MRSMRFVEWRPATAEDILALIKANYLDSVGNDLEVEEGVTISFEMTLKQWREACDLLPWRRLAPALNKWFRVNFKKPEWQTVSKPEKTKTLRDLCDFIAQQAMLPTVKVGRIMGKECLEGSTFMAIKQILQEAGVPTSKIRPSTSLAPFTRKYLEAFLTDLRRLAPRALPAPNVKWNLGQRMSCIFYLIGGIGLIAALVKSVAACLVVFIIFGMLVAGISSYFPPKLVTFGNLMTFRDLTYAFVNEINKETKAS